MLKRTAFTLAETLIALLIIGIVAAMTLPSFIHDITEKANATKVAVFNSKFIQSLNSAKAAGGLNNTYSSTYDFVKNGLSHHLKMTTICDNKHLKDCFGYDDIIYENGYNEEAESKISNLKSASDLHINGKNFSNTAAFTMADGTPVLLTYNTKCTTDGGADKTISPCVAGLFDINGSRKPNMFLNKIILGGNGKAKAQTGDIRSFNGARLGRCISNIDGVCIVSTFIEGNGENYEQMFNAIKESDENYVRPELDELNYDNWQLAEDYCEKIISDEYDGVLLDPEHLAQIATVLYGTKIGEKETKKGLNWSANKDVVFSALGIMNTNIRDFDLWSYSPINKYLGTIRKFEDNYTNWFDPNRDDMYGVICEYF